MNPQAIVDDSNTLTDNVLLETSRWSRLIGIGARGTLTLDGANNLSFVTDKPKNLRYNFNVSASKISHLNFIHTMGGRIAITTDDGVVHSFSFSAPGFRPQISRAAALIGTIQTIERAEVWKKSLGEIVPEDKQQKLSHPFRNIMRAVGIIMLIAFVGIFLAFYFASRGK